MRMVGWFHGVRVTLVGTIPNGVQAAISDGLADDEQGCADEPGGWLARVGQHLVNIDSDGNVRVLVADTEADARQVVRSHAAYAKV